MAQKIRHPAYQRILTMGESAVPLILDDLRQRHPARWFHALYEITGENPIPENSRGVFTEMVAAWLEWGKQQGYSDAG